MNHEPRVSFLDQTHPCTPPKRGMGYWLAFRWSPPRKGRSGFTAVNDNSRIVGTPRNPHPAPFKFQRCIAAIAAFFILTAVSTQAHWKTESFRLKPGWNAIYSHVDVKYADLSTLVDTTAISEIWLWAPTFSSRQFIVSPDTPTDTGSNWQFWRRSNPAAATLNKLIGNAAYLVKYDGPTDFVWEVRGIPVPPVYQWSADGENFLGLSTPAASPPNFDNYLAEDGTLQQTIEIFQYAGGELDANPVRVIAQAQTLVNRGQAFWMRAENFNSYYHPFDLSLQRAAGIDFSSSTAAYTVRIRNRTDSALTVNLGLLASEAPPLQSFLDSGDPDASPDSLPGVRYDTPVAGLPPVVVRGVFNASTLDFAFSSLNAADHAVTLQPEGTPGSDLDVVIGINLAQLGGNPGDLFAGIVRFTDSLGYAAIDVPLRVVKHSLRGLWIGDAQVSRVENSTTVSPTQTFGATSTTAPLRLILHHGTDPNDSALQTRLLQRVYFGYGPTFNPVVSTTETVLAPEFLNLARRISAVHLPWSESNLPWDFTGTFNSGGTITAHVDVLFDDQRSNPFLHTYHPDHDNKNAFFDASQPRGEESYSIARDITLSFQAANNSFDAVTKDGSHSLTGDYSELITILGKGAESKNYRVQGTFSLVHLSQDMPLELGTLVGTP